MITYVKGDATRPQGNGQKLIVHCCNDVGAWGAGFVLALSKRWPEVEQAYRDWFDGRLSHQIDEAPPFELGQFIRVPVTEDIEVINLIGQSGTVRSSGIPPIRYDALQRGFQGVAMNAEKMNASIHMPRIGCGLAGGDWSLVEKIIEQEFGHLNVTVYDLQ